MRLIGILVNLHISTGIFKRITRAIIVKISVEMYQCTSIPMTRFNVSLMLQNFYHFKLINPSWNVVLSARNSILSVRKITNFISSQYFQSCANRIAKSSVELHSKNWFFEWFSTKENSFWCVFWPISVCEHMITQRNLFEILLNHSEIRLYLPFSDWFEIKQISIYLLEYCKRYLTELFKKYCISVEW